MPKRQFKASSGLVEKVARKQSGVIEKAWLEAVMNSVDAGATEINIRVEEEWSEISDNGDSMTQEEVQQYFEHFGMEDEDIEDKEFGKFRIGRGQIFNFGVNIWRAKENYMVVSLDDGEVAVNLEDCTTQEDDSIIEVNDDIYRLDTEGLGYVLLDADTIDEGLNIFVDHYQAIENLEQTIDNFMELVKYVSWMHDVTITINGEEVRSDPQLVKETDNAFFAHAPDKYTNRSVVYNKGARVDEFSLGPRRLCIISKRDLDVTLDRTDILDTDEYWQDIQSDYKRTIIEMFLEEDDLSTQQRNWLLEEAAHDASLIQSIQDKPLLKDVDGNHLTITEIANSQVSFADEDDTVASEANKEPGVHMVSSNHKPSLEEFVEFAPDTIEKSELTTYAQVVQEKMAFEMEEVDTSDLSKRRRKNFRILREALNDVGFAGSVKAGYSNHKNVWKDDDDVLYIHKDLLNVDKQTLATEVFLKVTRIAGHSGDSRAGTNEDFSMKRNFYDMVFANKIRSDSTLAEAQAKILSGKYN